MKKAITTIEKSETERKKTNGQRKLTLGRIDAAQGSRGRVVAPK